MAIGIIVRVLAYGVPALLIILGWISVTGGKIIETITGTSEGTVAMGVGMIIVGVLIYVVELFIGIR